MSEVNQSRRSFLKSTGAVGAGALVAGIGVGSLVQPRTAHAAALGYLAVPNIALVDANLVRELTWKWYFSGAG